LSIPGAEPTSAVVQRPESAPERRAILSDPRAISSAVERCLHTAEVAGSKPASPTREAPAEGLLLGSARAVAVTRARTSTLDGLRLTHPKSCGRTGRTVRTGTGPGRGPHFFGVLSTRRARRAKPTNRWACGRVAAEHCARQFQAPDAGVVRARWQCAGRLCRRARASRASIRRCAAASCVSPVQRPWSPA
jgi:hypothetical protein